MIVQLTVFAALTIAYNAEAARVLGLFPHTGKSHQMVFNPLLLKLAERGHHVTVVSFFPIENPPANYTDISLESIAEPAVEAVDLSSFEYSNKIVQLMGLEKEMYEIPGIQFNPLDVCSKLVNFLPLEEVLKKEYDVVLVEHFNSDCMLGLAYVYGIRGPMIALRSSSMLPWSADRMGITDNPSYVPLISGDYTAKMTFPQRLKNTLLNIYYKLWFRYSIQIKEANIIQRHFGRKIPDLDELAKNMTLILLNVFHSLNGVRPLLPGIIEVGGMHINHNRKPENIPSYIERFLNESDNGVVLFSFGSLIKTFSIPKYKEDIIVKALSKLKHKVIWKYEHTGEEETIEGNILKVKWLPQFELLQHKKVIAFVGHGGLLGMTEAIYAGKPMLILPFFGDQHFNAAQAQNIGYGIVVSYEQLSVASMYEGLKRVLNSEMRLSATRASEIWKDRQNDPLDTAVYWTERVIRWGNTDQLHSIARDLSIHQYLLLDVAAVLVTTMLLLFFIIKLITIFVFRQIKNSFYYKPKQKIS